MDVPEIDIPALETAMADGAYLLDVREPDEFEQARLPGARLVPLPDIPLRSGEIPTTGTVYVLCARGSRSAKATEFLRGRGVDAVNVAGGMMAWLESGRGFDSGRAES